MPIICFICLLRYYVCVLRKRMSSQKVPIICFICLLRYHVCVCSSQKVLILPISCAHQGSPNPRGRTNVSTRKQKYFILHRPRRSVFHFAFALFPAVVFVDVVLFYTDPVYGNYEYLLLLVLVLSLSLLCTISLLRIILLFNS